MVAARLAFLIYFLQFKSIEPDAATATIANINDETAYLRLGQFVETCRTFHSSNLHPRESELQY
jgi:hypothetical protein